MHSIWLALSGVVLFSSALGGYVPLSTGKTHQRFITDVMVKPKFDKKLDADICPLCTEFAQQTLQALVQLILQVGVLDSCGDLCELLAEKTGSEVIGDVCQILCDIVGIKEFVNIIDNADLDPIYYCELLKACPINDNGDAKFTSFEVTPKVGHKGDTFTLSFQYVSKNGTGTGMIELDVDAPDGAGPADAFLHELAPAGTYDGSIQLKAEKDCNPNQDPDCETWGHGNYTVTITLCNGECGSKHPHSAIYDSATAEFEIRKKKDD